MLVEYPKGVGGSMIGATLNEKAFLTSLEALKKALLEEFSERTKTLKKMYGIQQEIFCHIGSTLDPLDF